MTRSDDMYKCHICAEEFEKAWSDEDAKKEFHERFPDGDIKDAVIVCDRCDLLLQAFWRPVTRDDQERLLYKAFHHPITEEERKDEQRKNI